LPGTISTAPAASGREKMTMVQVTRSSSVDLSQSVVVAKFETLAEAEQYIAAHTVDGVNVSDEAECDYLWIGNDAE